MNSLNDTPSANRIHIGIFGSVNSGKSSIVNAITGQNVAIVSDKMGTTTDPVVKVMELAPIGPCVFIDTAGFGDESDLSTKRLEKTKQAILKSDIAILVFDAGHFDKKSASEIAHYLNEDNCNELLWYKELCDKKIPTLFVINKKDKFEASSTLLSDVLKTKLNVDCVVVSAQNRVGIDELKNSLARLIPENMGTEQITAGLVNDGDVVLLVMPQDIQAPKGRLILPQVQTIRELLDKKCICMCVTTDKMKESLDKLCQPPRLIITDSQAFEYVYQNKPKESLLTSFSVLFAAYKGDIDYYVEGALAIEKLTEASKVLIAECCTHAPLSEDIGRIQIPRMLRRKVGEKLSIDIVGGMDFPKDISKYDLIIQCGACMFNRRYVLSRISHAKTSGIPMTNYGITIAHLTGILDKISIPDSKL